MAENPEETGNGPDHPGVRLPPPVAGLGALLLGLGLDQIWPLPFATLGWSLPWAVLIALGVILVLAGIGLILASILRFKAADTALEPWKPTTSLVGQGPYRLSRNPIYLGMLLFLAGAALIADSLWVLLLMLPVWAFLRYGVIAREERYLEGKFGEDYLRYKTAVRRWF